MSLRSATAALVLTAAAFWDAGRWYAARVADQPEEAIALCCTVILILLLGWSGRSARRSTGEFPFAVIGLLLALYAASFWFAPPIVRAAIALSALMYALYRLLTGSAPPVAFWPLLALSLPVLPSLQFVLGYPLRLVSASITVALLDMQGLTLAREGTFITWQGRTLQFDAPCSGIAMLWAALMLALMAAVIGRWAVARTALAMCAATVFAIAGNAFRAASLFYAETRLGIGEDHPLHEAAGLAAFTLAAVALLAVLRTIDRRTGKTTCPT